MTELQDLLRPHDGPGSKRLYGGSWRHLVASDIQQLTADLEVARQQLDQHPNARYGTQQSVHLENAALFLRNAGWAVNEKTTPSRWLQGFLVDSAFVSLHHAMAESMFVLPEAIIHARLPQAIERGAAELGANDRRVEVVREIDRRKWRGNHVNSGALHRGYGYHDRAHMAELVHDCYAHRDEAYATSRSFRNRIIKLTAIATVVLAAVLWGAAIWGWSMEPLGVTAPNGDPVRWTDTMSSSGAVIFTAVALMGAVGGFLCGIRAVANIKGKRNPFSLPFYQMLLKLPVGGLSAIVGVLVLQVGFVPGVLPSTTILGLLVWAVVFGAAQQGITRLVDQRVQTLVGNGATTEEPDEAPAPSAAPPIDVADTTPASTQRVVKEERHPVLLRRAVR